MKRFFIFSMLFIMFATTFCASMQISTFAETNIEINSKSACLVDYASGQVLYEKDSKKHLPIASMVKMMTILLTIEEFDKGSLTEDTLIVTSEKASSMGGSQVFIDPHQEYKAGDLLKSVIISSANDASVALAEHISGSEETFVSKMNERAKSLNMQNTIYANCTGLPAPEAYSCAFDCAIILKEVAKSDLYHKYSTIWMDELVHPSGRKTELVNTNRLIRYYDGCDGGKTGSTNEAGCCLSASAKRNNMRLISVVIGAQNSKMRFNECSKLFNYGFANFENKFILNSASPCKNLKVTKGEKSNIDVFAREDFSVVVKKGDKSSYDVTYDIKNELSAPLKENSSVGKAIISCNGKIVKEIDLVIKENIDKLTLKDYFNRVSSAW